MFGYNAPARDGAFRHVGNIARFGVAQLETLAIDRPLDNTLPQRLVLQAIEAVDEMPRGGGRDRRCLDDLRVRLRFELAEIRRGRLKIGWPERMRHLCHKARGHIGHRGTARPVSKSLDLFNNIFGWQALKAGVFRPPAAIGQVAIPTWIDALTLCVQHHLRRGWVRIGKPIDRLRPVKVGLVEDDWRAGQAHHRGRARCGCACCGAKPGEGPFERRCGGGRDSDKCRENT